VLYVLTTGQELVIQDTNTEPTFTVDEPGIYTIHTLVFDPATLDLGIITPGVTTGFDVNELLIQGGGDICAALDVEGAFFDIDFCPECTADAGALMPMTMGDQPCLSLEDSTATLMANVVEEPTLPDTSYQIFYVLTEGDSLVIQGVSRQPEFTVTEPARYTIHTLVFDPATLDLSIVEPGETTGFDVNALLIQGGGVICGALDVEGARFDIDFCPEDVCTAEAGTLTAVGDPCLFEGSSVLNAEEDVAPNVPEGFQVLYVLTQGEDLIIQDVSETPSFTVESQGRFTIHTLVFDPETLDLGIIEFGATTGFDVNALLVQGGGDICAALDVNGAQFNIEACPDCQASAGTMIPLFEPCFKFQIAALQAYTGERPNLPVGYEIRYVLTSGEDLVIEQISRIPYFVVERTGRFTIHAFVFNPDELDLSIIEFGTTTAGEVLSLLLQGGGDICAALDVAGAQFDLGECGASARSAALNAYPNPVSNQLTVEFPVTEKAQFETITVELFDVNGRLVKSAEYNGWTAQERINVSNLTDGIYLMRVMADGRLLETMRITKMK